jgi:CRP-like cAMP-binding protein
MNNLLLAHLPGEALETLRPHFERLTLLHGQYAIVPDEPIRYFYFPLNCLLSMVTTMMDGQTVECSIIGREGVSGIPVLLDAERTPMPTFVQVPGEAVRVRAEVVKSLYESNKEVRRYFNRFIHTVIITGSNSAACNSLHKIGERFARWLLMASDGVGSDDVALTQDYLAMMLGVRRAGVTEAAGRLKEEGLISYQRGHIRILDRERLEVRSCECYGRTKAEYDRLLSTAGLRTVVG